jgi:EAL and modified HD-GYP domain-containing signal transduction protein
MGYMLAVDGFILDSGNISLLDIADIIKIDFTSATIETQAALIRKYKRKVRFFAHNIETREEYRQASDIGYDLFEGNFFSKPSVVNSKEIEPLDMNLLNIIHVLNAPEPDYIVISNIIEHDLALSYKLLKFVNSAYIASWYRINSIYRAVTYLGTRALRQFVLLIMMKNMNNSENAELIRLSLVRGRLMSLLAKELGMKETGSEYFFTGMFSLIDVILNKSMESVLKELPILNSVKQALLGADNDMRRMLNFIICYEKAQWDEIEGQYPMNIIGKNRIVSLYIDALKWANLLDDN